MNKLSTTTTNVIQVILSNNSQDCKKMIKLRMIYIFNVFSCSCVPV